nr:MAG TPA: hypothetical protein [Caudoviricetes sp.]
MMETIEAILVLVVILSAIGAVTIIIFPVILWALVWTVKILCIVVFCYIIYRLIQGVFGCAR